MSERRIDWEAVRRRLADSEVAVERSLSPDPARMRALLRQRAVRLAERRLEERPEPTVEVLGFRLGEERCAIELTAVSEVRPFRRCTPVPGLVPEMLGVVNLRGHIRPVVELGRVVGSKGAAAPTEDRPGYILFLRDGAAEIGARVDAVSAVRRLRTGDMSAADGGDGGLSSRFARAVAGDGLVLLDAAALVEALRKILVPAG